MKIALHDFLRRVRHEKLFSISKKINRSAKINPQAAVCWAVSYRSDALTHESTSISFFDLSLLRIISCPLRHVFAQAKQG